MMRDKNGAENENAIDFSPAALYADDGDNTFSVKIGGTFFDVTTHFNADGTQTVLEQFKKLILSKKLLA